MNVCMYNICTLLIVHTAKKKNVLEGQLELSLTQFLLKIL